MADGRARLRKAEGEIAELKAEVEALRAAQNMHPGHGYCCHGGHHWHGCLHWWPAATTVTYPYTYTVGYTGTTSAAGAGYTNLTITN